MKLIIGLGNPGRDYEKTRHNVGFMVVDALKKSSLYKTFKSDKFMNDSGAFVSKMLKAYSIKPEALYIVHDDLDIKLGEYKIQFGRGPKDHNGITSVEKELGTKDFWRVRVGVDNRMGDPSFAKATAGKEYVLQNFSDDEMSTIDKVIKETCEKLKKI